MGRKSRKPKTPKKASTGVADAEVHSHSSIPAVASQPKCELAMLAIQLSLNLINILILPLWDLTKILLYKVNRPNLGHVLIWVTSNKTANCGPQEDCTASLRRSNYTPFYARYSHIREAVVASVSLTQAALETLKVTLG